MHIARIWMSQRRLRRAGQIPAMIKASENGDLPPITLARCEDGEIQLEDGHHRLTAIWLSGRKVLEDHEYIVVEKDQWKRRFGKIEDVIGSTRFVGNHSGCNPDVSD